MNYVSGQSRSLHAATFAAHARYRHRVFVEKLGWELQSTNELEFDQFDREDTVYVVSHAADGEVNGIARLLPTTGAYLLSEVFPQLFGGQELPCSPEVWELSRFAAVDFSIAAASRAPMSQFSSPVAIELLHQALARAAERGARHLVTVSPLGVERLLRNAGFKAHRAAPPMLIAGRPTVACWIEI